MRTDVEKYSFSGKAAGDTLVDIDVSDCFQVGFAIDVDSVTGTPTSYRGVAIALYGSTPEVLGSASEHIRKTADMTAPGVAFFGQRGTAVGEIAFENVYKKVRVIADFTGGTTPTMTGSLYVFAKRAA
jgi:hypothetical protein